MKQQQNVVVPVVVKTESKRRTKNEKREVGRIFLGKMGRYTRLI